jgi:hypothetical protein
MPIGPQASTSQQQTLLDFSGAPPQNSLSDFAPDPNIVAPVTNDASNVNMAAHTAILSGNPSQAIATYNQSRAELSQSGQSAQTQQVFDQARRDSFDQAKGALSTMLADPTMPLQDKQNAILGVYDQNSAMYQPNNILSAKMLQAPSSTNTEAEDVRFNLLDVMHGVNEVKRQQQIVYNGAMAKLQSDQENQGLTGAISNFLGTQLPFSNQANVGLIGQQFGGSTWDRVKAVFDPGGETQDIRQRLLDMPPDQRVQATKDLIDVVNNNSGIVAQTDNDYRAMQDLQKFVADGGYTNHQAWADNFMGVADLATSFGSAAADLAEGAKAARASQAETAAADNLGRGYSSPQTGPQVGPRSPSGGSGTVYGTWESPSPRQNTVVDPVQPASVANNVKDFNPNQYQNLHEMAASDPTGEAARALYGTDRDSAIYSDLAPQVATADGSVKAKVATPDQINNQVVTPTPDMRHYSGYDGAIYYTDAEKAAQQSMVVNDFQQAVGMTDRKEMFQVQSLENDLNGNTLRIKGVYGPQDSGFSDPDDAMNMAQWAFRKYGLDQNDIQLLQRVGGEYVPVDYTPGMGNNPAGTVFQNDPGFKDYSNEFNLSDADIAADNANGHFAQATTKSGSNINLTGVIRPAGDVREIHAFDTQGNKIGSVIYSQGSRVDNPNVQVNPSWQRKGVASAMYDYAEKHGAKFPGSNTQQNMRSEAGQAFRDARSIGKTNDYLVQVNHDYKLNPANQNYWDNLDVKNNFWMKTGMFQGISHEGSLQRSLVNVTSMLDPTITLGFSKAALKEGSVVSNLLKMAKDKVATPYNSLKSREQARVNDLILDMNSRGYEATPSQMRSYGLSNNEQNVIQGWRQYWDQIYYLENMDHTKTLINQGYKKFVDSANDTMVYARPVPRSSVGNVIRVWNHATGGMEGWDKSAIDELYKKQGTIAELRSPFKVGDEVAEHIASPENMNGGYLRGMKPDDVTLNYRPGYYHVAYKDPHFIVKQVKNSQGYPLYEKAIATASNAREADLLTKRLQATDQFNSYYHRPDIKHMPNERAATAARDAYDIATSQGRSPQRVRGRRLEDVTQQTIDPTHTNIVSPIQSAINSARSIARRTAMRDPLDVTKYRFLNQYGKYVPTKNGQPVFPNNVSDIKYRGEGGYDRNELAGARSTFEHIDYMQHGYENHLEDAYDAALKGVADVLGEKSIKYDSKALAKGEQFFHSLAAHNSPLQKAQGMAYSLYIAANPLRQMLMHGHQALNNVAIHPTFFATPKPYTQMMYLLGKQLGIPDNKLMYDAMGMTKDEAGELWNQFRTSGINSSVDQHALIRTGLRTMADQMNNKPGAVIGRTLTYPLYLARKIGFDAGEHFNMNMAWLTQRDMALQQGLDLSKREVQDMVTAKAANFTGNFNRSGDMAYNHNTLSAMMQFFQWSHKWCGLVTGNRVLTPTQKISMIGTTLALWGIPLGAGGIYEMDRWMGSKAPQDQATRDALQNGIVGQMYNALLTGIDRLSGDKNARMSRIDFGSLGPSDLNGMYEHIADIMNGKIGNIFADSPAGVLFGGNKAVNNWVKSVARYGHLMYDDKENPETLSQVAHNFLQIFPGMSNAFKAAYAWQVGKKISSYTGKIEDTNVTTPEALAQAAGLPTLNQTNGAFAQQMYLNNKEQVTKDFDYFWDNMKTKLLSDGITPDSLQYQQRISSEVWRMWGNDNEFVRNLYNQHLQADAERGDFRLFHQAIQLGQMAQTGFTPMSKDQATAIVNQFPNMTPDQKNTYLNIINTINANKVNPPAPRSFVDRMLDHEEQ